MFKFYRSVLAAGAVALGLAACGDNVTVTNPPPVTPIVHSVTVVPASQTVNVGQAGVTFVASVVADSGKVSTVKWTSTNPTVATVGLTTGVISALAPGQATIVATSDGDNSKTGAGSLTVVALPNNISAFSVNPTNGNIAVGGTLQANPTVTVIQGAPAATITWATSNQSIAQVNANGTITGVAAGTAIITATANSGGQLATATVGVTVGNGPAGVISFSVSPSAVTLFASQTQVATATVNTNSALVAGSQTVTWSTSAPSVATVNGGATTGGPIYTSLGTITAVAQGSAIITATIGTAPNTISQSVVVTVAQGASISIAAVNSGATAGTIPGCAGIANTPVVLTNVNCQIDVVLNLNAGVQPLDSLNVYVQRGVVALGAPTFQGKASPVCAVAAGCPFYKRLANQSYGNTIPSSGPVNLSINTANFTKNAPAGTAVVDLYNGPAGLISQLFPHNLVGGQVTDCQIGAADQQCASVNSMVFTNTDGWSSDIQRCSGNGLAASPGTIVGISLAAGTPPTCSAPVLNVTIGTGGTNSSSGGVSTDVGGAGANLGNTYWGGPGPNGSTEAELYAVIYNNNPAFPAGSALNRCKSQAGLGADCLSAVTWTIGSPAAGGAGTCTAIVAPAVGGVVTLPIRSAFGTGAATTGTMTACVYQNTSTIRDNAIVFSSIDAQNNPFTTVGVANGCIPVGCNPNFTLIPNSVVFGATPDSSRFDYFAPTITNPDVRGSENQNWVNANWNFNQCGGGCVADGGVGPANGTWAAFATLNNGGAAFPTYIVNGTNLAETNTNCIGGVCDGYNAKAWGTDRLGNIGGSGTVGSFGDDRTAPVVRYSVTTAPSSYGPSYGNGGGAALGAAQDSTTYFAIWGRYGANVVTAGALQTFLAPAAATNDSFRIETIDFRSGINRAVQATVKFAQGGTNGTVSTVSSFNTLIGAFTAPFTIDGWAAAPSMHVINGRIGSVIVPTQAGPVPADAVNSGYFTTTGYSVDKAGNVSGCPATGTISGVLGVSSICTVAAPSTAVASNPAVPGIAGSAAVQGSGATFTTPQVVAVVGSPNEFVRRTLAMDNVQPIITGVSPNNSYTGNSAQTWSLGASDDLEVIDGRLRIQYPNLTNGDVAGTIAASQGLVYSFALSTTFFPPNGNGTGPALGAATAGSNAYGFFAPMGIRFDGLPAVAGTFGGIMNPVVTGLAPIPAMTLDQFTLNTQETCTNGVATPAGVATGPTTATFCTSGTTFVGDPISTVAGPVGVPLTKPNNIGAQVRDVFGSWSFNNLIGGSATTGVSAELVSAILPATVQTVTSGYSVGYSGASLCPQGGAVGLGACVTSGVNWRGDGGSGSTRNFRAVQALSVTLPIFTRVDLFGLSATTGEWVFIQRCVTPSPILPSTGPQNCGVGGATGTVTGTDNGNERYWVYSFTAIPSVASFTKFRALGVNGVGSPTGTGIATPVGSGLFSSVEP